WNEYFAPDIKQHHHERDQKNSREHFERARLIGLRPGMSRRSSEKVAHFVAREAVGNSTSAPSGFVIASVGPEVHLARSRSGQSPVVADHIRCADACHKRTRRPPQF